MSQMARFCLVRRIKGHLSALRLLHPHMDDGAGLCWRLGPDLEALQQLCAGSIECVRADIDLGTLAVCVIAATHQSHIQTLTREQQGQSLTHHACATEANIKLGFHHAAILGWQRAKTGRHPQELRGFADGVFHPNPLDS